MCWINGTEAIATFGCSGIYGSKADRAPSHCIATNFLCIEGILGYRELSQREQGEWPEDECYEKPAVYVSTPGASSDSCEAGENRIDSDKKYEKVSHGFLCGHEDFPFALAITCQASQM